jgi:hypothetical protein
MKNAQNAANPYMHEFTGRKPSTRQALAKAKQFANKGADFVSLTWGENWIDLTLSEAGYWYGHGWLKDIDGAWVARELNHAKDIKRVFAQKLGCPIEFLNEKLTIVHIK